MVRSWYCTGRLRICLVEIGIVPHDPIFTRDGLVLSSLSSRPDSGAIYILRQFLYGLHFNIASDVHQCVSNSFHDSGECHQRMQFGLAYQWMMELANSFSSAPFTCSIILGWLTICRNGSC
jgi:hypothetical protein